MREDADLADRRHDLATPSAALPRRQREAIVLRYLVGLPEADTADTMGCTIGTVKSTTARGLTRMRGRLRSAMGVGGLTMFDEFRAPVPTDPGMREFAIVATRARAIRRRRRAVTTSSALAVTGLLASPR